MTTVPVPYCTTRTVEPDTAARPLTLIWPRYDALTTDGLMLGKKSQASSELRWKVLPVTGFVVPVIQSSDLPVMVTTVLASVAEVWVWLSRLRTAVDWRSGGSKPFVVRDEPAPRLITSAAGAGVSSVAAAVTSGGSRWPARSPARS